MSEEDSNKCEQLSLLDLKKMYYSISEVCSATSLEPHVLRYWESEFPTLRPKKNRGGKRAYQDKDIEVICQIKRLLYEENYKISGARQKLSEDRQAEAAQAGSPKRARSKTDKALNAQSVQDSSLSESCPEQSDLQCSESAMPAQILPDQISSIKKELKEILALLK